MSRISEVIRSAACSPQAALPMAGLALLLMLQLAGCPVSDGAGLALPPGSVQAVISAGEGGTLTGETGIVLEIPPGALPVDTEITVIPLDENELAELDPKFVAGVILEPDGLEMAQPARLMVPLPEDWPADAPPAELTFHGNDASYAIATGLLVELSEDGRTAIFEIRHFCGRIAATNCHGGAFEYLVQDWTSRFPGCTEEGIRTRIKGKYPDITIPEISAGGFRAGHIQAIADTFFDEVYKYNPGEPVPDGVTLQLTQWHNQGRNVLMLLGPKLDQRTGPHNFYPGGNIWHAATVEYLDKDWQIRHSFPVTRKMLRDFVGGTNLAYWPLEMRDPGSAVFMDRQDLTTFKESIEGVAIECYVCGEPGCGAPPPDMYPDHPDYMKYPYNPLDQRDQRHLWAAVHVYVEREDNHPCNRLTGCWKSEVPDEGETATLLLCIDQDGDLDSMWFGATYVEGQEPEGVQPGQMIFIEIMRFTNKVGRANCEAVAEDLQSLHQSITLNADQSGFSMTFGWETTEDDGEGGRRISSRVSYAIKNAVLCTNVPEETFTGTFEHHEIEYSYDEEGSRSEEREDQVVAINAERVPCPEPDNVTGITQEYFVAHVAELMGQLIMEGFESIFGSLAGLCGAGAGGGLMLTMVGLVGLKFAPARYRRRWLRRGS